MAQQINLLKVEALDPLRAELQDAVDDAQAARDDAQDARHDAQLARDDAETAQNAAFINAAVFDTTGDGIAGTGHGDQFQVVEGDELVRYRNSSGTAIEVARYPAAQGLARLLADHGHISALLGQVGREIERLRRTQGEAPPMPAAVAALAAITNQMARQLDGGRIRLSGGTLADPALWIGDAALYQSVANTLSVAVAGIERLRITTSGITVYGTVTEA